MEKTVEWRKSLAKQFPYLMPKNSFTGKISDTYDYSYLVGEHDLPKGWFNLFLQMCEDIREPLERCGQIDEFAFFQVKEKYGSMRCYVGGTTEEVMNIIEKYEFLSYQVCCVCGAPATVMTHGYICPYCSEHVRGGIENVVDSELLDIKTSYIRKTFCNGDTTETEVDCSDEWTRYLSRIGYANET